MRLAVVGQALRLPSQVSESGKRNACPTTLLVAAYPCYPRNPWLNVQP
jgi:hypothetical protein